MAIEPIENPAWRLLLDGDPVEVVHLSGVSELGPLLTMSLNIEIIDSGNAPALKQAVDLRFRDTDAAVSWPVFSGFVQGSVSTSDPNKIVIKCQGELSLLRDTWDSDEDFTGESDGDVVIEALDDSAITYASGNIQSASYTLGAIKPVKGTKRQARSQIVKSLNEMLWMALVEIGGTPVRFAYSLVPNVDDIVRTFARAETIDFYGNERTLGLMDDIKNYVTVNGVSFSCDDDGDPDEDGGCTCQIFGTGQDTNPTLGSGVRTEDSPKSFPAAQSQTLIEWYIGRYLEAFNRIGDKLLIPTAFHPEQVIGLTVGVSDDAPGINLTDDAEDTPYLITKVEIDDFDCTLTLVGGAAGETGTITSRVDQQCNKDVGTGPDITGGFTPPPITPPPIPTATPDSCYDLLDAGYIAGWAHPSESLARWNATIGEIAIKQLTTSGTPAQGRHAGVKVPANRAWQLTVQFKLHQEQAAIGFGISQTGLTHDFEGSAAGSAFGAIDDISAVVFPTSDGHAGSPVVDTIYTAVLTWLPSTTTLTLTGLGADITISEPAATALWTMGGVPFLLSNLASGGDIAHDNVFVYQYELCLIDEPEGGCLDAVAGDICADWVEDDSGWAPPGVSSWSFDCGTSLVASVDACIFPQLGQGPGAYLRTGVPSLGTDWALTVEGTHSLDDALIFLSVIDNTGGASYIQKAGVEWPSTTVSRYDYVYLDDGLGNDYENTGNATLGASFKATVSRSGTDVRFLLESPPGTIVLDQTLATDWDTGASGDDLLIELVAFSDGSGGDVCGGGTMTITRVDFCPGGDPIPADAWGIVAGFEGSPFTFGSGTASNADTDDADAYVTTQTLDGSQRVRWSGHMDVNASDEVILTVALDDSEIGGGPEFAGFQVTITGGVTTLDIQSWDDFASASPDLTGGFDWSIDADPADNSLTVTVAGTSYVLTLGTWPGPMTPHIQHGSGGTVDWDLTNMRLAVG